MDQQESSIAANESFPLLNNADGTGGRNGRAARRGRMSRVFRLLRRRNGHRLMREPSILVREAAAEQLENRQSDFTYSRPVVIVDMIWNLTFIMAAVVMLITSREERPSNPLRVWIAGYALQCGIHIGCVLAEYRRRRTGNRDQGDSSLPSSSSLPEGSPADRGYSSYILDEESSQTISIAKRIESANTSFSFVWWVVGFYWTTTGNQSQDAPVLFWLSIAFLAFDVFFVIFCVSLACIIGVAVCCCLPCIIAIMHAMTDQEGASENDINMLPRFKFRCSGIHGKTGNGDLTGPSGGVMTMIVSSGPALERVLPLEDAECCICLMPYEDGIDLRELPCKHHFHCTCIDRWLRMNSTCPLCKYNISSNGSTDREDV